MVTSSALSLDLCPLTLQPTVSFDVAIVGAGLAGVGAACHLQRCCPKRRFVILEARDSIGGTWDLFRYPGVRSDSDMHTLGYAFRPWTGEKSIADGHLIREYIQDTAAEAGIDQKILFHRKVTSASWSSDAARWVLEARNTENGTIESFSCQFLIMASGYYSYTEGYAPKFEGEDQFGGRIVHPQFWPQDLDHTDRTVVVIGSGATAITLIPAIARTARHVIMLQRSPSYIVSRPARDPLMESLRKWLPVPIASEFVRLKYIILAALFYRFVRRHPERTKKFFLYQVRRELGPDYDIATHFTPKYKPWDQRVCLVPDSDFFKVVREGRASVVTDEIDSFTATGIRLRSGNELGADIIVKATGLKLNLLGDVRFSVDGQNTDMSKAMLYKGAMLSDVPNFAVLSGYTNASWTLKAELISAYLCRLLNYMKRRHYAIVVPQHDPAVPEESASVLTSGYIQRAKDLLPRQGARAPWKLKQSYPYDLLMLRWGRLNDGVLAFKHLKRRFWRFG